MIDFAGRLSALKDYALAYRDLSSGGDSSEAAAKVFDALRWAENVQGAERVYFPEIVVSQPASDTIATPVGEEDALTLAVKDRLTRASALVRCSFGLPRSASCTHERCRYSRLQ